MWRNEETQWLLVFIISRVLFRASLCNNNDKPLLKWSIVPINKSDDTLLISPGVSFLGHLQRVWSEKSLNPSSVCNFPNNPKNIRLACMPMWGRCPKRGLDLAGFRANLERKKNRGEWIVGFVLFFQKKTKQFYLWLPTSGMSNVRFS